MNTNRWLALMDGVFVVLIILCACVITRELGMTGYTKRCLIGLCCGVMGYFLSGYLVIHAYRIKKKLGLLLEEMTQDREEEKW